MMRYITRFVPVLLAAGIISCGGGGGGGGEQPRSLPEGQTTGTAYDGPLSNATINAYDFEDGTKGKFLGSTTTDSDGNYSLSIQHVDAIILLEATQGEYPEEATLRNVTLSGDQKLQAVVQYDQGGSIDVQLTHHTTWAACYARYRMAELGENTVNAVIRANEVLTNLAGVPITETRPLNVTQSDSVSPVLTPGHRAGFLAAGISQLVYDTQLRDGVSGNNNLYTSINFSNIVCRDIESDGLLDGIGPVSNANPSGQLYLGNQPITANFYRTRIAQEILNFANTENNRTSLTATDLLEYANSIALNEHAVFNGIAVSGVDQEGPVITPSVSNGALLSDEAQIDFIITDPLGVKSVSFYFDNEFLGDGIAAEPSALINTILYQDGEYVLTVVATDNLDNESTESVTVNIVNTTVGIDLTSPLLTSESNYTATGSYVENGAPIESILVNGVNATIDVETQTWEALITLQGGTNTIQIEAYDILGNVTLATESVAVDRVDPELNSYDTRVRFSDFSGQLNLCQYGDLNISNNTSSSICLNAERVALNGAQVHRSLSSEDYILLGVDMEDPQRQGVFTEISDLTLEYRAHLNGELLVDWRLAPRPNPSERTAYIPVTTEYFGDNFFRVSRSDVFNVEVRLIDAAGNQDSLEFNFTLDVLTPDFTTTQNITNSSIFSTSYATRETLNAADVHIEHTWENHSSIPYMIQVSAIDDYQVSQTYESAQRENRARTVTNYEWRGRQFIRYSRFAWTNNFTFFWSDYETITEVQQGRVNPITHRPPVSTRGEYMNISSDIITAQNPSNWYDIHDRFQVNPGCTHSGVFTTLGGTSATYYDQDDDLRCIALHTEHTLQERIFYSVEYAPGFPRNNITNHTTDYAVGNAAIRVFNDTNAVEIIPQEGWYSVPSNASITIRKTVRLPTILNHIDARVGANADDVPYGSQISQDTELRYELNTGITITRAIHAGSVSEVNNVSHTQSSHGDSDQVFSINRF